MSLNGGTIGLGYILTAKDLASAVIGRVTGSLQRLDQTVGASTDNIAHAFGRLGGATAILAASAAPLAVTLGSAVRAGEFSRGLAAVGAAAQATHKEMTALHDAAMQAGIATQFSPSEAVGGLISLATAGQTATQAIGTLLPTLDLAAASLGDLTVSQAAEAVVGTLNSYAWSANRAAEVTDKLVAIGNLTNFQAKDLSVGLSRAAEAGALFGQSFDDILVGMGLLRNRNIAADVASTALRNALIRVNSDLRSQDILLRAGVSLRDQYTGQLRSILDVMSDFAGATAHLDPLTLHPMVKDVFGEEAMPAFSAVMNATFTTVEKGAATTYQGTQAIAALRREMQNAGGAAAQFVQRYNDNFAGRMTLLRGTLQGWSTAIGEVFGDVLMPVVEHVTHGLNSLLAAFIAIPAPIKRIGAAGVLAATALVAVGGAIQGITVLAGLVGAAFSAAWAPLVAIFAAASGALSAIGLPIALVGTAISAFVAAYRLRMSQLGHATQKQIPLITTFWQGLQQIMGSGALRGDVLGNLNATPWLKDMVVGVYKVGAAFGGLWEGVKEGFASCVGFAGPAFDLLHGSLQAIGQSWGHLAGIVGKSFQLLAPALRITLRVVGWVLGGILAYFATSLALVANVVAWIPRVILGTADTIASFIVRTVRGVKNLGAALATGVATWWRTSGLHAWCKQVRALLPQAFKHAADGILAVLQKLGGNLRRLFGAIAQMIFKPFASVPAEFRPPGTGPLQTFRTPKVSAVEAPMTTAVSAARSGTAFPAVADLQSRRPQVAPTLDAAKPATSSPVHVELKLDGETIARAVAKASRQLAARQFQPLMGY